MYLILPLIYLIVSMSVFKMSVTKSGITSIIATIVCTLFSARNRITPDKLKKDCEGLHQRGQTLFIACGVVGIIIGIVMGSGLGFRMSSVLIQVSNGHLESCWC